MGKSMSKCKWDFMLGLVSCLKWVLCFGLCLGCECTIYVFKVKTKFGLGSICQVKLRRWVKGMSWIGSKRWMRYVLCVRLEVCVGGMGFIGWDECNIFKMFW